MPKKHLLASLLLCGLIALAAVFAVVVLQRRGIFAAIAPSASAPLLPNGSLIRAEGDPRVYYVDEGRKRWIDSPETLRVHGLRWEDVVAVSLIELGRYPEGERLTAASRISRPGELLPDLTPFAAKEMRLAMLEGRRVLRFTATFWNRGSAALELVADPAQPPTAEGLQATFQRIPQSGGTTRDTLVGDFLWHAPHKHYHYSDFADYVFTLVKPAPGSPAAVPPVITKKSTFCLRDDEPVARDLTGAPRTGRFTSCNPYRQGVSVGWADVYRFTLPDQYIDVHDVPAGVYQLTFNVDPRRRFVESRQDNNVSVAFVELDPATGSMSVIATGAAFQSAANRYPDGMVIRGDTDSRIYITHGNKKRWLRTDEVFRALGYGDGDVFALPQSVLEAIPREMVVRPAGSPDIYVLNEHGYRRHILTMDAFRAYGWTAADVTEITRAEFDSYPDTDLIMRAGDNRVYSIRDGRFIGSFDALPLGRDQESVHVVNDADFNAYAMEVVAEGLQVPWDIVFLPDGDMLVTERPGTLKRIGAHPATIALPGVLHVGEGGLMGMALHPDFARNRLVYLYFTTGEGGRGNRIERFRLEDDRLVEDKVILEGIPAALYHDGGQLIFGPDGMLYVTTGDAEQPALSKDVQSLAGKTLRLTPDGDIPADNPFGNAVWSYGHRNAQGITWDDRGRMWQTEHGRSGALSGLDELNLIERGKNYGWPDSQGNTVAPGTVGPVRHSGSTVTWAPSGIAYADGSLFFAGLRGASLYEAKLGADGGIADFRAHFGGSYGRLRAVVLGPDGFLYLTTSNRDGRGTPRPGDDKILRVRPEFLR